MPTTWALTDVYRPIGKTKTLRMEGTLTIQNEIEPNTTYGNTHVTKFYGLASACGFHAPSANLSGAFDYLLGVRIQSSNRLGVPGTSDPLLTAAPQINIGAYYNPTGSVAGTRQVNTVSATGVITADYVLELDVEIFVAPQARGFNTASTPGEPYPAQDGTLATFGTSPENWGGGSATKALVAIYKPKVGGTYKATITSSAGSATVSGTITPSSAATRLSLDLGCTGSLCADSFSFAGFSGFSTASATGSIMGQGIVLGGHPSGFVTSYFWSGLISGDLNTYSADFSGGASLSNAGGGGPTAGGPVPSNAFPEIDLGPRITGGPTTEYTLTGQVHRGYGNYSVATKFRAGRSRSATIRDIALGTGSFSALYKVPYAIRAEIKGGYRGSPPGYATQEYIAPWGFVGTLLPATGSVLPGFSRNGVMIRCKPFPYLTYTQALNPSVPIPPAPNWNFDVGTATGGVGFTNITGGVKKTFTTSTPISAEPRYLRAQYKSESSTANTQRLLNAPRIGAYRYLSFEIRVDGADNQPIALILDNRSWTASTDVDGAWRTVEVDLLDPTKAPSDVDATLSQQDTSLSQRDNGSGIPVNLGTITWGVDKIGTLQVNVGNGTAYSIRNVKVRRVGSPVFNGFSEVTGDRSGSVEVDGRRAFEFFWDATKLSNASAAARMIGLTVADIPPTDADWGWSGNPQHILAGGFLSPTPPGANKVVLHQGLTTVWGQARGLHAHAMPDMGDVFGYGTAVSGTTPLYMEPAAGGAIDGVTYDAGGHPASGGSISVKEAVAGIAGGAGTGGSLGSYFSGAPFFNATVQERAEGLSAHFDFFPIETLSVRRVCLRAPQKGGSIHLAKFHGDGGILETVAADGTVNTTTRNLGGDPIEGEVGSGTSAQSYIHPRGHFVSFRSQDGETIESRSYDQGETWTDV